MNNTARKIDTQVEQVEQKVTNLADYKQAKDFLVHGEQFILWLSSSDAQEAFFLWQAKQEKQAALKGCGALCASCARKDLTTCQCYAGHIQSTNYPVTKCRDYREEGAPAVSED